MSTFQKRPVAVLQWEHPFEFVSAISFCWSQYVESCSSLPASSHPLLSHVQCFLTSMQQNILYVLVSQSGRNICKFAMDLGMRSMLSANLNSRPLTAIVPMKPSNACVLVCSKKCRSGLETRCNFSEL